MTESKLTRIDIEARERTFLAGYAALSGESRGRAYPSHPHPLRTAFQRDRDRIVHAAAFRRLEYKTQVFIPHERDHFRTRLTHTIEVAQISRTIARNLRLNEDLAEAIALAHDLGHTPFGHSGEDALNELLKSVGGFNHNRQSLRIVDYLEQRYREHPGLNLSYEVREGIAKHETGGKVDLSDFSPDEQPTLEAALVDIADEIAYNAHDIDDGLSSQIITFDDIMESSFWKGLCDATELKPDGLNDEERRHALVRSMINLMATDLIDQTLGRISSMGIHSLQDVRSSRENICGYSDDVKELAKQIKQFLSERLYKHEHLKNMSRWAETVMIRLYEAFTADPTLMSAKYQERAELEELNTVVADYIAGMTDRYARETYDSIK